MTQQYVPDDVREFILKHIDSVAQIEALLLIRANPAARWTLSRIASRLYTNEAQAAEAVDRLCADGLLLCVEGNYRLDGIAPETAVMIERLQQIYTSHLIPVTNIVHSKPRRIRSFADAFRFRKGS